MSIAPGERFAGYTVVRLLGAGGMGEVYLAAHPRLPRQDAIKVLRKDVSADAEYQARFEREADFAADLMHPNIVRVYDRGEHDGQLWISMEYVDGTDAGQLLRGGQGSGGLPADEVVHIISAVADAWTTHTSASCCTAISSPPTSCSPISAPSGHVCCSRISGLPGGWAIPVA